MRISNRSGTVRSTESRGRGASAAVLTLLVTMALLGAAAPAGASTASLSGTTLEITGGPESSDLSPDYLFSQNIEDKSGITPGPGCTAVSPTKVACPKWDSGLPDYTQIVMNMGDGNDKVAFGTSSVPMTINLEGGDDTVYGGSNKDAINGGDGNDSIYANEDSDVVDGGPGDDTLEGGSGNDRVIGGPGRDSVNGDGGSILGDGNDQLDIADGELDQAQCGLGADIVNADALDVVEAFSCEVINRPATKLSVTVPSRVKIASLLSSGLRLPARFTEAGTFKAVLSISGSQARKLRLGGRSVNLATTRGSIGTTKRTVVLRVSSRYRTALKRARRVSASVRITATSKSGRKASLVKGVVLVSSVRK